MTFLDLLKPQHVWRQLLVIGRTLERDGQVYHILGMTLAEEAKLYLIEPFFRPDEDAPQRRGVCNHRRLLKEQGASASSSYFLNCVGLRMGDQKFRVTGGTAEPMSQASGDFGMIRLFLDFLGAGWSVPSQLVEVPWENLQLVTLDVAEVDDLPADVSEIPVVLEHGKDWVRHVLGKSLTLSVGKSKTFHFVDHSGETVFCYMNRVIRIDVWQTVAEQLERLASSGQYTSEDLERAKRHTYQVLEETCPKGMCYIGVEYECSKDFSLQFYTKEYLNARPGTKGKNSQMGMRLKPDQEIGDHGLILRGCVLETPVPPDTQTIAAELLFYHDPKEAWEETF